MGLTSASKNRQEDVAARYKELNYDVIGISEYQKINGLMENEPSYIPVYEHGYGLLKSHELVIGAEKVSWYDFLFFQSFSNTQNVIVRLRNGNEVISVNHPRLRNAFTPEKLKYIRGYDLLEITSHSYFNATDLWDSVLSAGYPAFALGSDDNHDIYDPEDFGYVFTMINSEHANKIEILNSLRSGKAFAVEMEPQKDSSPQKKLEQASMVPVLTSCKIDYGILEMKFDKMFDTLKIIGQNGVLIDKAVKTNYMIYKIRNDDTYMRAELSINHMISVFLNPVFRYSGTFQKNEPEIDYTKTWLFRLLYTLVFVFFIFVYYKYKKSKYIGKRPV